MQVNSLTNEMVIDSKLAEQAKETHDYFTHMLNEAKGQPNLKDMHALGFQSIGKAQFIEGLNANIELAKKWQAVRNAYPGYMVVHEKHLLGWLLVNDLFMGNHYQFTGLIPEQNQEHIIKFNKLLRLQDCVIEYKTNGKWQAFDRKQLAAALPKITAYKGTNLHSVDGERVKFGKTKAGINFGGTYMTEANVRALPPYQMVADIKFFDKSAYLTDAAKDAAFYTPNPDPLVVLPVGEFRVIVTAWAHEEKLLPGLEAIATTNPL